MLNALIDRCCRWINVLIALALAVMVVMVFGNVVLRYAFNSGIAVSEEVSRWLFVWITFLGAIVAVKEHGHLGTDLVLTKLPPIAQRVCLVISHGLMLFCTWLLFSGALSQARINWDVEAPVTGASVAIKVVRPRVAWRIRSSMAWQVAPVSKAAAVRSGSLK